MTKLYLNHPKFRCAPLKVITFITLYYKKLIDINYETSILIYKDSLINCLDIEGHVQISLPINKYKITLYYRCIYLFI